ncbi:MAG TPA: sigma-70 family RNA polymerase sigma factor [Candidatus Nitrosotenuis sp.]|jgi:RNA polymerase sigma-70 factor (ECF subfamily)|nr:sigma-70 family RNA polymerase sigma factor [Candidatus Nitrosotenuis sp.]
MRPSEEDGILAARAKSGDGQAFEELVSRHGRRIYNVVLRMVHGDREEAEDLTQEVLLRAYQALPGFREESGFYTWLYRIAVNRTLNRLQRKKLAVRSLDEPLTDEDGERPRELPDASGDPQAVYAHRELARALERSLDQLNQTSRAVFVLREVEGMSHEQIALVLGSTSQAVRVRLHRAKKELMRLLSPWLAEGRS